MLTETDGEISLRKPVGFSKREITWGPQNNPRKMTQASGEQTRLQEPTRDF